MLGQPKLVLIILAVRDLARAVAFYREVFGWPVLVEVPVYVEMEMPGGQRVGLYDHEGFARNTGRCAACAPEDHTAATELYFHADDPAPLMERLGRAGARLLSPLGPRPWGDEAAFFADPEGNVLVVARPAGSNPSAERRIAGNLPTPGNPTIG